MNDTSKIGKISIKSFWIVERDLLNYHFLLIQKNLGLYFFNIKAELKKYPKIPLGIL